MIKPELILLFIFFCALLKVDAQTSYQTPKELYEVESFGYPIYIEKNAPLNLLSLKETDLNKLFSKHESDLPKFKAYSFWFYLDISDLPPDLIFEIFYPGANKISAYKISFNKTSKNEINKKVISKHRNDFHRVAIGDNSDYLFINIQTSRHSKLAIKSFTKNSLFLKERRLNIYYGFIVGVLLLLALYHLVLYIKVLDKLYLYYILLIIISGFLIVPHSGFINASSFLFYDITFTLFQISCVIISVSYLNIYQNNKRLTWLVILVILIVNSMGIIMPSNMLRYLSHGVSILIYITIILISISQIKKSFSPAKWYLLPWVTLLLAHLIYLLDVSFIFEYRQAIEVGFLANICLLALAIGNKLNIYKDQKRHAESKEIKAITERDKLIQDQNIILEQLINERNKKILERNTTLSEKQIEIEQNNEVIKETNQHLRIINHELLNKNNEISTQNQELKKHHELLEIIVNKRTKKLLTAKERAIVADKLKTSFLNNLTQEINTPMNAITGYANLLNDKNLTKEKRNNNLFLINKNVDILLESIDNVVILARIQAGILKVKQKQFYVKDLIENCNNLFNEKILAHDKKDIKLNYSHRGISENLGLYSDYEKLWQIIHRLVDNSIKYTDNGEIRITYEIIGRKDTDRDHTLTIKVQDTGAGIKKEKLDFILERLSNIEVDKTKLYHGAGIGLAIVKGLTDLFHGKIIAHSETDVGTSFQVEIPVLLVKKKDTN